MNKQISIILSEFRSAQARLHALPHVIPMNRWTIRVDPDRWSVAECIEHLNVTGRVYLPILHEALERAQRLKGRAPHTYRRDPIGWLLWKTMGPPVRQRVKTTAAFVPTSGKDPEELISDFDQLQAAQMALTEAADGLPLQKVRVQSPFNARVRYNLFSCLSILPPHQHRHLWQAEQLA